MAYMIMDKNMISGKLMSLNGICNYIVTSGIYDYNPIMDVDIYPYF
jgi:hypothetical protein